MVVRPVVAPSVLQWAGQVSGRPQASLTKQFPSWGKWVSSASAGPTLKQLQAVADFTGVPFGYLLLPNPPTLALPVADFREGYDGGHGTPSTDLLAVLHLSIRRQDWYRDYANENHLQPVQVVASAGTRSDFEIAAEMRRVLNFEVRDRPNKWSDCRTYLLDRFEEIGGLTVTTSMVDNNTHRPLNPEEFRGFSLVDQYAPLVFVNAKQTLNGQIFTLAHEFAHIWHGTSGISSEDPKRQPSTELEAWCNSVASEFLVPYQELVSHDSNVQHLPLPDRLDSLAQVFKCSTLVILQAIRRASLATFADFSATYDSELERLTALTPPSSAGGDFYNVQPFRIGRRLSHALIGDATEGRTRLADAMDLMSLRSITTFDTYAQRLGVA